MKTQIEHIFFDLDHTLWDFDRNSSLAFQKIFDKFSIDISVDSFLEVYQPINLKFWKRYREDKVSKQDLRRGRLMEAFKPLKYNFSLDTIDAIAEDYINFLPDNNYLIKGAEEILEFLKPRYDLHIITNGFKDVQNNKLQKSGIRTYFKTITNSEEAGFKKPHPVIFEKAIQESGADIEKSLMIGDNYEADILGAASYGLKTIFFNYHNEKVQEELPQVKQLLDLKLYL